MVIIRTFMIKVKKSWNFNELLTWTLHSNTDGCDSVNEMLYTTVMV